MSDMAYINTIDKGDWKLEVIYDDDTDRKGTIVVTALRNIYGVKEGEIILNEPVDISYGAIFGPDAADVALWQQMGLDAVDKKIDEAYPG